MKLRHILITTIIAFAAFSFTLKNEYKVDKEKTKVTWVGKKVAGQHNGTIAVSNGTLVSDGKTITGGKFDIDMTSIKNDDLTDQEYNQKLVGHLKSEDFFATDKFPKATLVITKVTPLGKDQHNVKGNLTIKGITKPVEFPATIKASDSQVTAKAKILVDRTKYDIKYGSGTFFDNLGDKAIDNDFELNVELVATK